MSNTNNNTVVRSFRSAAVQQTVVSARKIDLNDFVIATQDGNKTPSGATVPTGIYRIPTIPGSKFKQLAIPMNSDFLGVMEVALNLNPSDGWVKDDKLVLVFEDGLNNAAYNAKYGSSASGGIGQMSKRKSRARSPKPIFGYFDADTVKVEYRKVGLVRSISMDGVACWISRDMVVRTAEERISTEKNLNHKQVKAIRRMARNVKRVEATFMSADGQYKGDALVVNTKKYDIMVLEGTAKSQLKMNNGKVFVAVQGRHTSQLRFDVQTFMNIGTGGAFSKDQMGAWMQEYVDHRLEQFDSGKSVEIIDELFSKMKWKDDAEQILKFPLYDMVLSGLNPKWFRYTTESILKSGLQGLITKGIDELSFLVPGQNFYVMPASAFQMAGMDVHVARGEHRLIEHYASIVINDVDAVTCDPRFAAIDDLEKFCNGDQAVLDAIRKASPGYFQRLSGADNDDGIKVLPIEDNGVIKSLQMRSPNEIGQYVISTMSADSDMPVWCGKAVVPAKIDISKLPEQVSQGDRPSLHLTGDPIKIEGWSLQNLFDTAKIMVTSAGAVGIHGIRAWFEVQAYGSLPDGSDNRRPMPDEFSNIVDAAVKDFGDLSEVNVENEDGMIVLADATMQPGGPVIALCRADKFRAALPRGTEFKTAMTWVDECYLATDAVIDVYKEEIHKRGQQATPPVALFKKGLKFAHAGKGFRSTWGTWWFNHFKANPVDEPVQVSDEVYAADLFTPRDEVGETIKKEDMETMFGEVRAECFEYLKKFPKNLWPMTLVGGLAQTYAEASEHNQGIIKDDDYELRDAAFWQLGEMTDDGRVNGIGTLTVEGLRQCGIIGEIVWDVDNEEILVRDAKHPVASEVTTLKLRHVWFNLLVAQGKTTATSPFQIKDEQVILAAKAAAAAMVMDGLVISVGYKEVARKNKTDRYNVAFGPRGNVIGTLPEDTYMDYIADGGLRVIGSSTDGDYTWVVCEEVKA